MTPVLQAIVISATVIGACAYGGALLLNWLSAKGRESRPAPAAPPAPADTLAATPAAPKQLVRDSFDGDNPLDMLLHVTNKFARDGKRELAISALTLRMDAAEDGKPSPPQPE